MMMGSRNTTPPRMFLRIVPFGETGPHLLQAELGHPVLVRRDRGALNADAVFLDGVGGVDRHLVIGRVTVLDRQDS